MALVDTEDLISLSEASKQGLSKLVTEAAAGRRCVIVRNNHPAVAIVSIDWLTEAQNALEDWRDLTLALDRVSVDSGQRTSLDDVFALFNVTRDQLTDDDSES